MGQLSDKRLINLKNSIPSLVGERIKSLRKERGLTQTELAEFVGKDRQYMYKIEKGIVTPNIVTISALALALEIPLREIVDIEI